MDTQGQHLNFEKIVVGANPLQHFNVRCPACQKLFRIDSREIKSSVPHFDCTSCKARFGFDFPPTNVNKIETRVVQPTQVAQLSDSVDREALKDLRQCPKCAAYNPKTQRECMKCLALMDRVEAVGEDQSLGAIPSLVKAWQEIMADYDNVKKHVAFVNRCEDLQALPYALKKYQTLKEVQPHDSVAQKMFHEVFIKNIGGRAKKIPQVAQAKQVWISVSDRINWERVRKLFPMVLGAGFIVVGLGNAGARNLIGVGAAILFLIIGVRIFLKGRISLADFW